MEYIILGMPIIVLMTIFLLWQNNGLVVTNVSYKNNKLQKPLKVLHISDLHNKKFGKNQQRIIKKVKSINPDVILITGDTIDCHKTNVEVAKETISMFCRICPIYLISGNHEHECGNYKDFISAYKEAGATILDGKVITLKENNKIQLFGIPDLKTVSFGKNDIKTLEHFKTNLDNIIKEYDENKINILLAHRPELIDLYEKYKFDMVLSGHAHGGQFRFWFIKGVVAPGQRLFPKYTAGVYRKNKTTMIVSRGLGNSVIPIRLFNRPELVVINLEK